MIALAAAAVKKWLVELLARVTWRAAKLLFAIVWVLLWSACSGTGTVVMQASQPGGQARLRNVAVSGGLSLGGGGLALGGGSVVPLPGQPGFVGPVQGSTILPPPPLDQWAVMVSAVQNAPCAFPGVALIAALGFYESNYGAYPGPSSAGATGWAQFMPATYAKYGIPPSQGNDFRVMIPAAIRKLCDDGVATSVDRALYAYNPSQAYVAHVKALAASWANVVFSRWQDGPAFNQYDPRNWANPQNFQIWAAAACSAAALDWLLTAYGTPPGSIDGALALIGPNTGISSRVGLLDHTGQGLVSALGKAGYTAWRAHLSQQQLVDRLRSGPAMLDGQKWFGVGHWFVATGSDAGGVSIRESSGNDVRYLTWARLFGEVGWSGWAVGVNGPAAPSNQA